MQILAVLCSLAQRDQPFILKTLKTLHYISRALTFLCLCPDTLCSALERRESVMQQSTCVL